MGCQGDAKVSERAISHQASGGRMICGAALPRKLSARAREKQTRTPVLTVCLQEVLPKNIVP